MKYFARSTDSDEVGALGICNRRPACCMAASSRRQRLRDAQVHPALCNSLYLGHGGWKLIGS